MKADIAGGGRACPLLSVWEILCLSDQLYLVALSSTDFIPAPSVRGEHRRPVIMVGAPAVLGMAPERAHDGRLVRAHLWRDAGEVQWRCSGGAGEGAA